MGEIIIKHRAGGETRLQSKQATVKITKAEQRKQLLGEDTFNITIQSAQPIEIFIGDRIEIFGSVYTINQLPTIKKTGTRIFEQTIILEGTQYELIDVQFILPGNTMYDNLTGDLDDFIDVLIQNANRIYPGTWVKGFTPTGTETKTLSFSERNCLEVLQTLCEEYSTEFEIAVSTTGTRTLHIKQVGVQFPFPFTYGRTGGLYQLTRQNVNSKSVVTRLYVYGGRNNLGNTYRNSKLCLPGKLKNDSYIEDEIAVGLYGVKENTKTFDKIFPARYGTVTSLGEETFTFHDSSMDFDLNETEEGDPDTTKWLIHGIDAKVRFTTGNLAGYEFDVHSYDHTTKEIKIVPFVDESGYKFPSDTSSAFQIAIGDVYHFTDINLPLAYITEAEEKLETEGEKHYNQYRQPQVQYSLSIHPRFLEKYAGAQETISNIFALGDQIKVIDDDIGVDKSLRITGFTRDALDPYRYTLTLSEAAYNKTIINRIISDIEDITDIIEINNLADPFKARRNWMAAQELLNKIFDPEGYYYSEKIKPLSIETMMLQVGAKSQQFILENTRFEPNYLGNPNTINIIGGQLSHFTLNDTITIWNLTGGLISSLDPTKSYFVYAKCEVEGSNGVIIINDAQHKVDEDPMFYHFIIGHLSSVITNPDGSNPARILSLTYGSTTINGRFIKTGRIESSGGGSTYFDLDEGIIGGRIRFLSNGVETDLSTWADQILAELGDVDGAITDLEEYIDGAFADGIISEAEAKAIEKYINQINKEKNELEVVYNKTYLNPLLTGTPKTNLLNAKITLFGDIASLLNTINTAIADGAATPAEKQAVDAAFTTYSSSIDLFTTRLEEAKSLIQEVDLSGWATQILSELGDVDGAITDLEEYIDGTFKDGIISEAEAKAIEKYINQINKEKNELEVVYNKTYLNPTLTGTPKTNLLNAKITLFGDIASLLNTINTAIADGATTPAEKQAVDAAFATYSSSIDLFTTRLEEAKSLIQEVDLSDWATQILSELGDVDGAITDLEEYIDGTFKDGIIDEAEAKAIEKYINQINKEKNELEVVYYKTINNPLLATEPKNALINAKITLFGYIASLLNTINTAIADGATTPAEKQAVDAAFTTYSSSLDRFATRLEEARISIEQYLKGEADGARDAAAAAQAAANAASQDVEDISVIVDDLDIYIGGAFHDGVVEEAEAKAIEKYLNSLYETKLSVDGTYTQVHGNTYLEGTPKTNLASAKTALNTAYTNLVNSINTAIAGGSTTAAQKDDVDAKFALFNTALATYQVRVEEANKAIQDKLKSFSDEAKAKAAQADYLRAALQQSTDIEGGVVLGSIIAARDVSGQVRSYQNGDPDLNNTAFAAGVHDFGTEDETRTIGLNHDGSADIGVLRVTQEGKVVLVDPETEDERLIFLEQDIPTVEDLRASTTDGGETSNIARSGSTTFTLPNTMTVAKNNSNVTFQSNMVTINGTSAPSWPPPDPSQPIPQDAVSVFVEILRNGAYYALLGSRSLRFSQANEYQEASFAINRTFHNCMAGSYSIRVRVESSGNISSKNASISASTMSWEFNQDVDWFQFGLNGFMAWYLNNHIHVSREKGVDVRGGWNVPGVLLSATIGTSGGWSGVWGAKQSPTPPPAPSPTGRYTIYHTIGHTNYQVNCVSHTENRSFRVYAKNTNSVVVECRTIGSSPTLSNAMFDITLTGNNY